LHTHAHTFCGNDLRRQQQAVPELPRHERSRSADLRQKREVSTPKKNPRMHQTSPHTHTHTGE
jgi:hypothetical protein